jgi:hypothetical protein
MNEKPYKQIQVKTGKNFFICGGYFKGKFTDEESVLGEKILRYKIYQSQSKNGP